MPIGSCKLISIGVYDICSTCLVLLLYVRVLSGRTYLLEVTATCFHQKTFITPFYIEYMQSSSYVQRPGDVAREGWTQSTNPLLCSSWCLYELCDIMLLMLILHVKTNSWVEKSLNFFLFCINTHYYLAKHWNGPFLFVFYFILEKRKKTPPPF